MICKKESKKDIKLGEVRDQSWAPNLSCHTVSKFKENRKKNFLVKASCVALWEFFTGSIKTAN